MRRLAVLGGAAAALLVAAPILLAALVMAADASTLSPSDEAQADIPPDVLALYQAAAETCPGLEWTVAAAIGKVESDHGRAADQISPVGARGPMQFMPATFAQYAVDGDGDGRRDIEDLEDSVYSAVNYLCANGAGDPERLWSAIWHYNHSPTYVRKVLALAASYGVISFVDASPDVGALLANPAVILSDNARQDLVAGRVDPRVVATLNALSTRHSLAISVFSTGHSKYTSSGSVSHHFYGRAVDIWMIDGQPVSRHNLRARDVVLELGQLPDEIRPDELGHPFGSLSVPGGFSDVHHAGHLHAGFDI